MPDVSVRARGASGVNRKLCQVHVRAGRQLWPDAAPSFLDDLLAAVRSPPTRALGLRLIELLVHESLDPSRATVLSSRRRLLARGLSAAAPAVFAHAADALAAAAGADDGGGGGVGVEADALETLSTCAQWLPVSAQSVPPQLVPALCARFAAPSAAHRARALACARTLFERNVRAADAASLFVPALAHLEQALRRAAASPAEARRAEGATAEARALAECAQAMCAHVLPRIGGAATAPYSDEAGALLGALLALTCAPGTRAAARACYRAWATLLDGLGACVREEGTRARPLGLSRDEFCAAFGPGHGELLRHVLERRRVAARVLADELLRGPSPSRRGAQAAAGPGPADADADADDDSGASAASADEG